MIAYQTKVGKLPGTSYREVYRSARLAFKKIKSKTKRKPYIRSSYFNNQKIFFDFFWIHLGQKRKPERLRRLRYFEAALELIRHSRNHPLSRDNPNKLSEVFYRFSGITKGKEIFFVQIKEHKRTKRKQLMSIFPANKNE